LALHVDGQVTVPQPLEIVPWHEFCTQVGGEQWGGGTTSMMALADQSPCPVQPLLWTTMAKFPSGADELAQTLSAPPVVEAVMPDGSGGGVAIW
jgi:hypothetical protein